MPTASDPNTQYFAMPDAYAGTQPSAPSSAMQALLAQFLMPQPGQGGNGIAVPGQTWSDNPGPMQPMINLLNGKPPIDPNSALSNGGSNPMIMRDPGMSAGPAPNPAPAPSPMIPPPASQGAPGLSPALSALRQQTLSPPQMAMPSPTNPSPLKALQTQLATSPPAVSPASSNAPAMPQMPTHKENNLIKMIGLISGLMGGSGGQVAGSYLDAQKANDTANYGRAMQQFQQQQQTQQQQFQDTQAQARSAGNLLDNLAAMDAGTQQSVVEGMTPQQMQAYGYTPDTIKQQFYNADGTFKPVGAGADAKGDAALIRAQSDARTRLSAITPAAQQSLHDGMDKDTWESTYGVPYGSFSPSQLTRDVNGATSAQDRANADTATAQRGAMNTLLTMTPAMQATIQQGTDPQAFEQKYGVPSSAFRPGMTQKDANSLAAIAERATASRLAATTQTKIASGKSALQAFIASQRNTVTERGQDLTHGDRQAAIANKPQGGGASGSAADAAYARRLQRMTVLATPAKDPITGQPTGLSPAHQGGAAYTEYMNLKKLNNAYEAKNAGAGSSQTNNAAPSAALPNRYLNMTPAQRLAIARQRGLIK